MKLSFYKKKGKKKQKEESSIRKIHREQLLESDYLSQS